MALFNQITEKVKNLLGVNEFTLSKTYTYQTFEDALETAWKSIQTSSVDDIISGADITFSDEGITAPDASDIIGSLENLFKKAFGADLSLDFSTPQGQLIMVLGAAMAHQKAEMLRLTNQFNPLTARGIWQDAIGKVYFLERTPAEPTSVMVTCRGLPGVTLNGLDTTSPARIQDVNNNIYLCTNTVTIPSNASSVIAQFQNEVPGPIECPVGAIDTANGAGSIVTVIPGWDSAENVTAGSVGNDVESRAEFEARRFESVAINSRDTVQSVYANVANVLGVLSVLVMDNRTSLEVLQRGVTLPAHSIYVCVDGGSDADIAYAIIHNLSAGCVMVGSTSYTYIDELTTANTIVHFQRPTPVPIKFKVSVTHTSTEQNALIMKTIKDEMIGKYVYASGSANKRVGIGETIYAARFYPALIDAGVQGFISVTISLTASSYGQSVELDATQIPSVSDEDITIEVNP